MNRNPVRPPEARGGNAITGFGRYELPLLAAYSRCGTNWVRYIVEAVSGQPTPGQLRLHRGGNFRIDRAHRAFAVMPHYANVILLLRDYRECLLRHHRERWLAEPDVAAFLRATDPEQPPSWYIDNIAAFDRHEGRKLLLCYEDLLRDPAAEIPRLLAFLELDPDAGTRFMTDYAAHYRASVAAYTRFGHRSESTASGNLRFHAETLLDDATIAAFDDYYAVHHPDLAKRYLARYRAG